MNSFSSISINSLGKPIRKIIFILICTDLKTKEEEKNRQIKLLKEYCAKDTMAIYDLIRYLIVK